MSDEIDDVESAIVKGWIISGVFAWLAIALSTWLIRKHLINFTKPRYQCHIVRILLMVPVYSFCSWLNYRLVNWTLYLDFIRSLFESFVIYEFTALLLEYLGSNEVEQRRPLSFKQPMQHLFPFCFFTYNPSQQYFLNDVKLGVLQYICVRPLTTVCAIIMEAQGLYHAESYSPVYANFWVVGINFISTSVAMYALIIFFVTIRSDISQYKPITKFLSVKFVVFLTWWQSVIIGVWSILGLIPDSEYYSKDTAAVGIQSLLICVEMFCASVWHHSDICFGVGDFSVDVGGLGTGQNTSAWHSLQRCFNPSDTLHEIKMGIYHVFRRLWMFIMRRHGQPLSQQQDDMNMTLIVDLEELSMDQTGPVH